MAAGSRTVRLLACLIPFAFLAGCAADAVFLADPALAAIVGNNREFEKSLESAAEGLGRRLEVEWDPSDQLGTLWLETRLTQLDVPLVVLSPYFSLFAADIAAEHADAHFVALGAVNSVRAPRCRGDRLNRQAGAGWTGSAARL